MATKKLLPLTAALLLTGFGATANANTISLSPFGQVAGLGQQVTFELNMDFFETTVGGAIDLIYNPEILGFVSFEFDADFVANVADPDFLVQPDNCITDGAAISGCDVGFPELNGIGFGSFDGITGSHLVATVTFETLSTGVGTIEMFPNVDPWGTFFSAVDASEMTVIFGPAKVHVIPIPAAAWLMLGALGMLGFARRR